MDDAQLDATPVELPALTDPQIPKTTRKKLRRIIRAKRTPTDQVRFNYRERRCGACRRCPFGTNGTGVPCAWRGGLFTGDLYPGRIGAVIRVTKLPQLPQTLTYVVDVDQRADTPDNTLRALEKATQGWVTLVTTDSVIALRHNEELLGLFSGDMAKHLMADLSAEGREIPLLPERGPMVAQ